MNNELFLGIDTSNYKTSVGLVDNELNILKNIGTFLNVKTGEKGLRQSEAHFQHCKNLPKLLMEALDSDTYRGKIKAVGVATKPRNVAGSYMPVFMAGYTVAQSIATALQVPLYQFSHQEGHICAVQSYISLEEKKPAVFFHFSGGTTEALYKENEKLSIIGGTKDISYGQIIDRLGVKLGLNFPAGKYIDKIACEATTRDVIFKSIKVESGCFNLSGLQNQYQTALEAGVTQEIVIWNLMNVIAVSIEALIIELSNTYNVKDFVFTGGVSASSFLRKHFNDKLSKTVNLYYGHKELSGDNGVGVAILGRKEYVKSSNNSNATQQLFI